jgi:hypothetical protein
MSEHETLATESRLKWCNKCTKLTKHAVSGRRVGRCMECPAQGPSKKQIRDRQKREEERRNPKLFY